MKKRWVYCYWNTEINNVKIILTLTAFSVVRLFWSVLHLFDQCESVRQIKKSQIASVFFSNIALWPVLGLIRISSVKSFLIGKRWFTQIWLFPDMDQLWRHFPWEKNLSYSKDYPVDLQLLEVALNTEPDMGNQLYLSSMSWLRNCNF